MFETNFKISWETFRNNLSNGFSKLQQMQEFVDVTLASGGHFVKAHQNILAVASPYLKEMLKSTPCQHPVIFLGPISHTVLGFILEYIYSGEVSVPSCELGAFVEAAKLLHIAGIKDMQVPEVSPQTIVNNQSEVENEESDDVRTKSKTLNNIDFEIEVNIEESTNNSDNYKLTENCDPSLITQPLDNDLRSDIDFENLITIHNTRKRLPTDISTVQENQLEECFEENPVNNKIHNSESNSEVDNQANILIVPLDNNDKDASEISKKENGNKDITATPLYTRSNRGSLQMVMNRFIYYLHHTSYGKQKRRWRCINYRKNRCTAYIDTNGEIIIERKNVHTHPFHDSEILKIGRRKQFYTSITEINEQICQHQTDSNSKSNTDENTSNNTGQENQYKISIVFDQQQNTNNRMDE